MMTQNIDMRFRDKVESNPVNTRFRDISGPCVLAGFRLIKGTTPFAVSLSKDGFTQSIAISPSGARVTEDTDLINIVTVDPNADPGIIRTDGIYLRYIYGTNQAVADYIVVKGQAGSVTPNPNPNPLTHLLLGYVNVQPNSIDLIYTACFTSQPYGFASLDVAGSANFHGFATFDKPVTFSGAVTFQDGTTGGGGGGGGSALAAVARMPYPMVAAIGQTSVTLPSLYTPNTNSLFVFVDWVYQSQDLYLEQDSSTFVFYEALKGGEKIFAYWFQNLSLYTVAPHNHNDLYYTKSQIDTKGVRYLQDYMAGPTGRILTHNLGNTNYVILGIVPTTRSLDVGSISIDKRANDMTVYNSGGYLGTFDLAYVVKS